MLSGIQRADDLEIHEDPEFQRRSWIVQRCAWAIMVATVLLGLLGLFGPGPLSNATVGSKGGPLVLHYQRFGRVRSPMQLVAELRPGTSNVETRLWLNAEFLARNQIVDIEPEPQRVEAGPDRSAYVLRLTAPHRPTRVTISVRPDAAGPMRLRVGLDDSPPLGVFQFIYP